MEEKVKQTLTLIEEDGDSFAKRAEMYYKKRPELINFVEESYRAYRALAERYDHISGELQNANHTIATVFPERFQLAMEGEDEDGSPKTAIHSLNPNKLPKAEVPKPNIPKVPTIPMKDAKRQATLITTRMQQKKAAVNVSATSITASSRSKSEAFEKIDKLQKGILALQTEKEFVKTSYENGLAKYWEIENQIKEMQEKVFILQDEFSMSTVIEDDEAQTLMAATALESCEKTLHELQEKQEKSSEEARVEYQRIKDAHEKLKTLKNEFLHSRTDQQVLPNKDKSANADTKLENLNHAGYNMESQKHEQESVHEKIREHKEMNLNTSLTVTELGERIDELVDKVITLENSISSQTALIKRLRSETDDLQSHLKNLEEKSSLIEDSNTLSNKVRELEMELHGIQNLRQTVEDKKGDLQTHLSEACCNLDHLSEKLQTLKSAEGAEIVGSFQDVDVLNTPSQKEFKQQDVPSPDDGSVIPKERETKVDEEKNEVKDHREGNGCVLPKERETEGDDDKDDVQIQRKVDEDSVTPKDGRIEAQKDTDEVHDQRNVKDNRKEVPNMIHVVKDKEECHGQSEVSNSFDDVSVQCQDPIKQDEIEKQDSSPTSDNLPYIGLQQNETEEEDFPNWQQLFLNGLEDREKILLAEYTSILRNYKEIKKKLSEVEKKNRDSLFELTVQVRELKSANVMKDEEIRSLHQKLSILQTSSDEIMENSLTESKGSPQDSIKTDSSSQFSNIPSVNSEHGHIDDQHVEPTERTDELNATNTAEIPPTEEEEQEEIKVILVDEPRTVSTVEEKFRMDIDALLEENLEFWLRFSTSFHQIHKFQTAIQDLQAELSKLQENRKQEGSNARDQSLKSNARPIYKHLIEIQTELTVWLEQNALLKDELKCRFSSLCNIQEEISRVSKAASGAEVEFTSYQAAKFQGEVLNMKQENNKVANELQAGLDHVSGLQVEIDKTLSNLKEDFGLPGSKNHRHHPFQMRSRIPLRSIMFGIKSKKQKPSIFSCMSPALQKQYSDLTSGNQK